FRGAESFNGDVSGWSTGNVTDMGGIFANAASFNGDVSGWNVGQVSNLSDAFSGANSFAGDLSTWNISNVQYMYGMLSNTAISDESYEDMLTAWSALELEPGVTLGASGLSYCDAEGALSVLSETYGWMIDGAVRDCSEELLADISAAADGNDASGVTMDVLNGIIGLTGVDPSQL
ncbi:DUF285 domain-containing protein, partial [Alcanivorax sp. 1008]|uniref:DUF285 domain-containing protein n=1 Tax=Alcanivorax sp. 1008 TaxID=2816853 RepID=UPI001D2B9F04